MKKIKPVLLVSIISAIILSLASWCIFEGDWLFYLYLFTAGIIISLIQSETISYKFLGKLLIGDLVLNFLLVIFIYLKDYLLDISLAGSYFWGIFLIYLFIVFLGGLFGILFKGLYSLGKEKISGVIIAFGPLALITSSFSLSNLKMSGTVISNLYGWPYYLFIYEVKDVLLGYQIGRWHFPFSVLGYYLIFDYLFYLIILVLIYYFLKLISKFKKIDITKWLFFIFLSLVLVIISFMSFKQSYISYQIAKSGECQFDSDCIIVGNKCPFSCAVVSNQFKLDYISNLIYSFPSTCELNCTGYEEATCLDNHCRVVISPTEDNNNFLWNKIKESILSCNLNSIMQTHRREVTAVLKTGETIKAFEPEIDDIFDLTKQTGDNCGTIIMATE